MRGVRSEEERRWVTVEARCVHETEKAILIEVDAIEDTCWIPKSQIGPLSEVNEKGDEGPLQIPQWLAEEKGLD